ncbi:PaaI family thioesterase [Nocardia xishanensis]
MIQVEEITFPEHVHGYPSVAFGGFVAGVLATHCPAPTARVDFRAKVPVGTPLALAGAAVNGTALTDAQGQILAEIGAATLSLDVPPAPSWTETEALTAGVLSSGERPITSCYGCGAACEPGRGLRLFPWALPGRDLVAAAWVPDPALGAADGIVTTENVWAALDCPGGHAGFLLSGMRRGAVTAALTATLLRSVRAGEPHIAHAWPIGQDGRKYTVGVALSTADGELCAVSEALWVEPREA